MYLNYHCEGSGSQRSLSEGTSALSKEFKSSSSLPGRVNKRVVIALKTRVSAEDSHSETELDWKPQLTRRATKHNWLPWGKEKLQCIVCSRRLATHHNDGKDVCKYVTWPLVPYLTEFLTDHPELGSVSDYVLVKSNDQSWSLLGKKEKQGINQW